MSRTTPPVRLIKHDSIRTGDTIKVEQEYEDATVIKIGTVAKRDHSNYGTDYLTSAGVALYTHTRDDLTKARITLLKRDHTTDDEEGRLF
jgi:hypothetical protein